MRLLMFLYVIGITYSASAQVISNLDVLDQNQYILYEEVYEDQFVILYHQGNQLYRKAYDENGMLETITQLSKLSKTDANITYAVDLGNAELLVFYEDSQAFLRNYDTDEVTFLGYVGDSLAYSPYFLKTQKTEDGVYFSGISKYPSDQTFINIDWGHYYDFATKEFSFELDWDQKDSWINYEFIGKNSIVYLDKISNKEYNIVIRDCETNDSKVYPIFPTISDFVVKDENTLILLGSIIEERDPIEFNVADYNVLYEMKLNDGSMELVHKSRVFKRNGPSRRLVLLADSTIVFTQFYTPNYISAYLSTAIRALNPDYSNKWKIALDELDSIKFRTVDYGLRANAQNIYLIGNTESWEFGEDGLEFFLAIRDTMVDPDRDYIYPPNYEINFDSIIKMDFELTGRARSGREGLIHSEKNGFVRLLPNPATSYLQVESPFNSEYLVVELYDMQGNRVLSSPINQQSSLVEISSLANGTYFVKLLAEGRPFFSGLIVKVD